MSVDPLADQAPSWTPFRAYFNNPVSYVDPSGLYEQPKNVFQRFWNWATFRGKYNRFEDFKEQVASLGASVINVNYEEDFISYDIAYNITEVNPENDLDPLQPCYISTIGVSTGWLFTSEYNTFEAAYAGALLLGDYNIFIGRVKGSGAIEYSALDPIDLIGGSAGALVRLFTIRAATKAVAKGVGQLGFKEVQALTKTYSTELNAFFKSGGTKMASKEALLSYKELTTRILNGTGGAPATKLTETALKVQSQRLEMINKALETFK